VAFFDLFVRRKVPFDFFEAFPNPGFHGFWGLLRRMGFVLPCLAWDLCKRQQILYLSSIFPLLKISRFY